MGGQVPLLEGTYLRALLAITYYLWYKQKKCNTCNLLSVDYPAAWLISTRLNESRLGFAGLNTRHGSVRASWIGDVADGGVDGEDGEGSHGSLSAARHSANERNHSRRSAPIARLPSRHLSCTQLGRLLQRLALQRHHPWHFHWLFKFNYLPPRRRRPSMYCFTGLAMCMLVCFVVVWASWTDQRFFEKNL